MLTVSGLKQDLEFTRGLGDIIDVLKTAAMIQFRTFQMKEGPNKEFLKELEASFGFLPKESVNYHPYFFDRKKMPSLIMVVTSDEGFLGELNTLLINATLDQRKSDGDEIIVLGERGARYLEDVNEDFVFFPGVSDEISYKEVRGLSRYLLDNYTKKFGRILVIYPEFLSLTNQRVEILEFLPFKYSASHTTTIGYFLEEMLIEPSAEKVSDILIDLWIGYKLLDIFWSSKQSEYAARIMHLEGSTQELTHLNQKLSLDYSRQLHGLKDKAIREISASKIMLGKINK